MASRGGLNSDGVKLGLGANAVGDARRDQGGQHKAADIGNKGSITGSLATWPLCIHLNMGRPINQRAVQALGDQPLIFFLALGRAKLIRSYPEI